MLYNLIINECWAMVQFWRKSRMLGVETGPVPKRPHCALREVSKNCSKDYHFVLLYGI